MSTGLSDKLQKAAGGFMSASEEQQVKEQHGDSKKMAKLIQILKGKQDKDFKTFLKMLRSTTNAVWADELERRAKELKRGGSKSVRLACEIGNKKTPFSDTPKICAILWQSLHDGVISCNTTVKKVESMITPNLV